MFNFDFTSLEPTIIASFWIYFLGSFVVGLLLGITITNLFFKREKADLERKCKEAQDELKKSIAILADKEKKLSEYEKFDKNNPEYWNFVRKSSEDSELSKDKMRQDALREIYK